MSFKGGNLCPIFPWGLAGPDVSLGDEPQLEVPGVPRAGPHLRLGWFLLTCQLVWWVLRGNLCPIFPWGLAGPLTLMFNFTRVIKVSQEDKAQLSGFLLGSSTRHTRQSKAIPWDSSPSSLLSYSLGFRFGSLDSVALTYPCELIAQISLDKFESLLLCFKSINLSNVLSNFEAIWITLRHLLLVLIQRHFN